LRGLSRRRRLFRRLEHGRSSRIETAVGLRLRGHTVSPPI
jgi:hypothetical protein